MTDAALFAAFFLGGFTVAAIIAVAVVKVLVELHREDRLVVVGEREQWRSERRELLNRVLHPHVMPTAVQRQPANPDELARRRMMAADFAAVGRVVPASTQTNGTGDDLELP